MPINHFGRKFLLAAGFAVIGSASLGKTTYECSFADNRANNGWVPTQVVVSHASGAAEALVSDAMILSAFGEPQLQRVARDTDRKLVVEWDIRLEATDGSSASFNYVLVIQKQSGTATLNAFPGGYSNQFGSTGTCKIETE